MMSKQFDSRSLSSGQIGVFSRNRTRIGNNSWNSIPDGFYRLEIYLSFYVDFQEAELDHSLLPTVSDIESRTTKFIHSTPGKL